MSTLGIHRPVLVVGPVNGPAASWRPGARAAIVVAGLATGLGMIGLADRPRANAHVVPLAVAARAGVGPFSAVGLAARLRAADPIADFMRRGLVPDARAPKGWVPDAMGAPDICRLPRGDVRWAIAATRDPLMRRAAGSRRAHAARRRQRERALDGIATLDGTLRFQLSRGVPANGDKASAAAISAFEALRPLDIGALDEAEAPADGTVHGLGDPTKSAANLRAAAIGTAASALQFDDRPGRLSAAARAGLWNGTPATAMGVGYTLPNRIRLDAAGVTTVDAWTNVGKTFQVSTVASIPLE